MRCHREYVHGIKREEECDLNCNETVNNHDSDGSASMYLVPILGAEYSTVIKSCDLHKETHEIGNVIYHSLFAEGKKKRGVIRKLTKKLI